MTEAAIHQDVTKACGYGSNVGNRTVRAIAAGFAHPARLMAHLQRDFGAQGAQVANSPRLRGSARRVQKAIEGGHDVR
jgi:hypothetical protein